MDHGPEAQRSSQRHTLMSCDSCFLPQCLSAVVQVPSANISDTVQQNPTRCSVTQPCFFLSSSLHQQLYIFDLLFSQPLFFQLSVMMLDIHGLITVSPPLGLMWWFCASLWLIPIPCAMYAPCGSRRSSTFVPGRPSFWLAASWICATLTWMQLTEHGDP